MGWRLGNRFKREGTSVYLQLSHDVPTQQCKAIILQFKKKKRRLSLKKRIHLNTGDVDLTPGQGTQPVSCTAEPTHHN